MKPKNIRLFLDFATHSIVTEGNAAQHHSTYAYNRPLFYRDYGIRQYKAFGMTVKRRLYVSDEKDRYFYIHYSDTNAAAEHEKSKIGRMKKYLDIIKGKAVTILKGYKEYFYLEIYEPDGTFL